jgi:uracil-DNA glycosylase
MKYKTYLTGATSNFLKKVLDELFVYKTPQKIIAYVDKHKYDCLIQNPPYNGNKTSQ